ncbi:MAPEG family protein [Sphingomonas sp. BT-65]|uniref:MAPEG family protein n=1 Tax=Sphingomonas sp. BT-65 TaxID=2989821 RepID=UPI0022364F6C|nr:MAPEG family protein [Sphingomonas sp. BT-65]MCW4460318.1 MAPEG family protein [Sphingomonas sp. BT-65]
MHSQILGPVIALVGWSLVMWVWLYARRIPAMKAAKIDIGKLTGGTGPDLKQVIPAKSQWPADNYNHLMEQPTIFYAVCLTLALIGQGDNLNATIAWVYVILRIAHSIVQATVNRVMVRFTLFTLATIPLVMLTVHAAMGFWGLSFH